MYVFNADGTMQQANPDAGDPTASDSDGKGIWIADGSRIRGKWMEITADRSTHKFVSRGEILFDIQVKGNTFAGTLSAPLTTPTESSCRTFPLHPSTVSALRYHSRTGELGGHDPVSSYVRIDGDTP